ncbi:MAG TPA: zf-HC2 domain-containing protein, partial [Gemmatimonadaceae bacterium]|nr:zf-HC2 domain-containing protein [Gemmatimonadaceae bacterium]
FDAALPDYLERTLGGSLRASVERHLGECVRCTSLLRDIENIRDEAAALPELVPSRDLWQGIEARIAAPVIPLASRVERQRHFAPAWMGVAAAALIVSTAGITYLLTARSLQHTPSSNVALTTAPGNKVSTEPSSDSGSPPNATQTPAVDVTGGSAKTVGTAVRLARTEGPRQNTPARVASRTEQSERAHSDLVYGKEIEMLQAIVSRREIQLDSATVSIIKKNLEIIDAAIEQSRAALARDPASRLLGEQLTHALDKKVELLRTAAMLPAST